MKTIEPINEDSSLKYLCVKIEEDTLKQYRDGDFYSED